MLHFLIIIIRLNWRIGYDCNLSWPVLVDLFLHNYQLNNHIPLLNAIFSCHVFSYFNFTYPCRPFAHFRFNIQLDIHRPQLYFNQIFFFFPFIFNLCEKLSTKINQNHLKYCYNFKVLFSSLISNSFKKKTTVIWICPLSLSY